MSKKYVVSACLAGEICRYDGGTNTIDAVVELVKQGRAVCVCPEELGGLPTPRDPNEIMNGRVKTKAGRDCTEAFQQGAQKGLDIARAEGCTHAILKARSPSCGAGRIYDGTFSKKLIPGNGVFAALLIQHGFHVATEEEL